MFHGSRVSDVTTEPAERPHPAQAREIPQRIRYWRLKAGLTRQVLADKVGVDLSNVSHWERGQSYPQLMNLVRVCEVCGIEMRMFWAPLEDIVAPAKK